MKLYTSRYRSMTQVKLCKAVHGCARLCKAVHVMKTKKDIDVQGCAWLDKQSHADAAKHKEGKYKSQNVNFSAYLINPCKENSEKY